MKKINRAKRWMFGKAGSHFSSKSEVVTINAFLPLRGSLRWLLTKTSSLLVLGGCLAMAGLNADEELKLPEPKELSSYDKDVLAKMPALIDQNELWNDRYGGPQEVQYLYSRLGDFSFIENSNGVRENANLLWEILGLVSKMETVQDPIIRKNRLDMFKYMIDKRDAIYETAVRRLKEGRVALEASKEGAVNELANEIAESKAMGDEGGIERAKERHANRYGSIAFEDAARMLFAVKPFKDSARLIQEASLSWKAAKEKSAVSVKEAEAILTAKKEKKEMALKAEQESERQATSKAAEAATKKREDHENRLEKLKNLKFPIGSKVDDIVKTIAALGHSVTLGPYYQKQMSEEYKVADPLVQKYFKTIGKEDAGYLRDLSYIGIEGADRYIAGHDAGGATILLATVTLKKKMKLFEADHFLSEIQKMYKPLDDPGIRLLKQANLSLCLIGSPLSGYTLADTKPGDASKSAKLPEIDGAWGGFGRLMVIDTQAMRMEVSGVTREGLDGPKFTIRDLKNEKGRYILSAVNSDSTAFVACEIQVGGEAKGAREIHCKLEVAATEEAAAERVHHTKDSDAEDFKYVAPKYRQACFLLSESDIPTYVESVGINECIVKVLKVHPDILKIIENLKSLDATKEATEKKEALKKLDTDL